MEIAAQIIGILGMSMNILSYQFKSRKKLIAIQLLGGLLFTVHYLLLGLVEETILIGCVLNFISVFRSIVYINKEKLRADKPIWIAVFSLLFIVAYVLVFTVFGMEPSFKNLAVEVLPTVSMIVSTFALSMSDSKKIRKISLFYCPLWLVYNLIRGSLGGSLCETFSIVSSFIGILRHDIKSNPKKKK